MTRYPIVDELIYINGKVLNNHKILSGELDIRDRSALRAAVARPASSAFGEDAYPTLPQKASALLHSIARNHPFTDGNKRTATVGCLFMLRINGAEAVWEPKDALQQILSVAQGTRDVPDFADWLTLRDCPSIPEQEAEQDMQLIDSLIEEHEWLLTELDKQ